MEIGEVVATSLISIRSQYENEIKRLEERIIEAEEDIKILNLNLTQRLSHTEEKESDSLRVGSRVVGVQQLRARMERKYSNRDMRRDAIVKEITQSTDVLEDK